MRHTSASEHRTQERGGAPGHPWGALCACGARIQGLQNRWVPRSELGGKTARLRGEAQSALQLARTCAARGAFRHAEPGDLAGMLSRFSKLRKPPVMRELDAIVAFVEQEVVARSRAGSLAGWSPKHLAMTANGLSKGTGAGTRQALAHLAQALPETHWLTQQRGWTAQALAMMANALAKGEGIGTCQALNRLARALLAPGQLRLASWTVQDLVMMANGLARGEGPDIRRALTGLAQAVLRHAPLTQEAWAARDLAMMANALA